jgi:hypothetical protein
VKLKQKTLSDLSSMICGDQPCDGVFPYRSSSFLTQFFYDCELPYTHNGSTRRLWVLDTLEKINSQPNESGEPLNAAMRAVLLELIDISHFRRAQLDQAAAVDYLNDSLSRDGICVRMNGQAAFEVALLGDTQWPHGMDHARSPLSPEEQKAREKVANLLETLSEDEFTDQILVPLFQSMGFHRVTPSGHREKILEFGNDLWMKLQVPTGHWLYFCAQIKRGKIDSGGKSGVANVSEVLNQARMAIDNPIFDPDSGRNVLIDHIYVISASTITRAARQWLVQNLDQHQRRTIIFMDSREFLDLSAKVVQLPGL